MQPSRSSIDLTGGATSNEPLESRVDDDLHRDGVIGQKKLCQIWKDIAATICPGWQTGPPVNFGAPAHGKLMADQWRSCIEFDIPVSIVQQWAADTDISNDNRRQKLVESTMYLARALRYAASHRDDCLVVSGTSSPRPSNIKSGIILNLR